MLLADAASKRRCVDGQQSPRASSGACHAASLALPPRVRATRAEETGSEAAPAVPAQAAPHPPRLLRRVADIPALRAETDSAVVTAASRPAARIRRSAPASARDARKLAKQAVRRRPRLAAAIADTAASHKRTSAAAKRVALRKRDRREREASRAAAPRREAVILRDSTRHAAAGNTAAAASHGTARGKAAAGKRARVPSADEHRTTAHGELSTARRSVRLTPAGTDSADGPVAAARAGAAPADGAAAATNGRSAPRHAASRGVAARSEQTTSRHASGGGSKKRKCVVHLPCV